MFFENPRDSEMSFSEVRVEEMGGGRERACGAKLGSQGLKGNVTAWALNKMKCFIGSSYKEVSRNKPTNPPKIPSFLLGPSDSSLLRSLRHLIAYIWLFSKIPLWLSEPSLRT